MVGLAQYCVSCSSTVGALRGGAGATRALLFGRERRMARRARRSALIRMNDALDLRRWREGGFVVTKLLAAMEPPSDEPEHEVRVLSSEDDLRLRAMELTMEMERCLKDESGKRSFVASSFRLTGTTPCDASVAAAEGTSWPPWAHKFGTISSCSCCCLT
jgi:hypothetical protein